MIRRFTAGLALAAMLALTALPALGYEAAVYIHMPNVDVFSCPRIDCDKVFTVRGGEKLEILETDGGWAKISTPDGIGWLQRDYINEG